MKLSTINSRLITAATAVFAAFVAFAADVSDVIVRQQWPWSTDIKVEFKLTNVTTPVTVNVEASDGDTPLDTTNLKNAITGDLWGISQSGVYTFKIDPKIAFGEERNAVGDFKVRLSLTDEPTADDILYKIVDLTKNNTWTDVRRPPDSRRREVLPVPEGHHVRHKRLLHGGPGHQGLVHQGLLHRRLRVDAAAVPQPYDFLWLDHVLHDEHRLPSYAPC